MLRLLQNFQTKASFVKRQSQKITNKKQHIANIVTKTTHTGFLFVVILQDLGLTYLFFSPFVTFFFYKKPDLPLQNK